MYISSRFEMYADDLKIFNNSSSSAQLQRDIDSIHAWSNTWLLPINEGKCAALHLGFNNPQNSYFVGGARIGPVASHSDLGVTVTSDLSWSEQTAKVVKRANSLLFVALKAFPNPTPRVLSKIFTTYIRPILESSVPVWSPWLIKDITLLENVQRRMSRSCPQIRRLTYQQRLERLQLVPLEQRRLTADLTLCYKIMHSYFTIDLSNMFVLSQNATLRGHGFKLARERFHRSSREFFFTNRVFRSWNSLSQDVADSPTVFIFKRRLRATSLP